MFDDCAWKYIEMKPIQKGTSPLEPAAHAIFLACAVYIFII